MFKICSKCKISKNLDDFAACKKAVDGKQYTNLQPLWAIDNLKKSNKIEI